jgi:hypothetical protein
MLACLFFYFVSYEKVIHDAMKNQLEMKAVATWMNDNLAIPQKIGVFNAGIQNYFSRHIVINLDGLVNDDAYKAMARHELWNFIQRERITYIADYDVYMTYRYKSFFGIPSPFDYLERFHTISTGAHNRSTDGIHVYKVLDKAITPSIINRTK